MKLESRRTGGSIEYALVRGAIRAFVSNAAFAGANVVLIGSLVIAWHGAPRVSLQDAAEVALISGLLVALLRFAGDTVPCCLFVRRVVRFFRLEASGPNCRTFARIVRPAATRQELERCIEALLTAHTVLVREKSEEWSEWIVRVQTSRFRIRVEWIAPQAARIEVRPVSRFIRACFVAGEGMGAEIISSILTAAADRGLIRKDFEEDDVPADLRAELTAFASKLNP